jgi:ABC-2 type transport system permease protein
MNNKLFVIARKDIGEAFRSRSTYVVIIIMILLTVSYISIYTQYVKNLSIDPQFFDDYSRQQAINNYSQAFLDSLAYVLPMMFSIFVCSVFANYAVIVDKAKRNIESLMATPISIKQIWLGKSLAVTLPSIGVGVSVAIVSYLVMAIWFVMPQTGSFVFPGIWAIVSTLVIVPVLLFMIVTIVTYIQLVITNPRIGNFVFSGIFFLLLFGINALGGLGISLSYLALVYVGVIVLCALISWILSFFLTKEKVLLSSKV